MKISKNGENLYIHQDFCGSKWQKPNSNFLKQKLIYITEKSKGVLRFR